MVRTCRAASLLALLILLSTSHAMAQQVVSGTVVDAARGDALPAASVQVAGTYQGTITNAEGSFSLRLDTLPGAVKVDAPLREAGAVVPLTGAERLAYASIDSTMSLREIYQPRGPVGRLMRARAEAEGRRDDGLDLRDRLDLRFAPKLWFNRVDALHAGLGLKSAPTERLRLRGEGGYSTGPTGGDRWSYGGGASVLWGVDLQGEVGFNYDVANTSRYYTDLYPPLFNSLNMLFGGADYFDYFRTERFAARAGYELLALQTTVSLTYRDERHTSLSKATSYDLLGQSEPLRPNPPVEAGRLRSVGVSVVYAQDEALLSFFGRRRVEVSVEHSASDVLASDFGFTRYALAADWRFDTFFQRRALPNTLDVRLAAATFSGALPLQRFGIVDGRLGPYTPFGALKTLSGRPYEGEQHVAVYWEHNFRTVPFEALGLRALAERGYNLVLHGAHGRTWISDARRSALEATFGYEPNLSDGFHHELGLSLSGLFGVLRVDFAKRLDAGGFSVGLSSARVF